MSHYLRIFSISTIFLFIINGLLVQSVADPAAPVLFTEEEQKYHQEKMKNMSDEEKQQYRTEQYQILRTKAAAIGYEMPEMPPWAGQTVAKENKLDPAVGRMHKKQLEKYRQEAADKRQAMHQRLEEQRKNIKKRIATLVERNGVKPSVEAPPVPVAPKPATPPKAFKPVYPQAQRFAPAPPMNTLGRNYPGFYRVPPPMYAYPY